MESSPELLPGVVSCVRCEIRFLAHPRNFGRTDLRCPFGCRELHRRQRSCQRSVAYYQTAAGRQKKQHLNDRRKRSAPVPCPPPPPATPPPPPLAPPSLSIESLPEVSPERAEWQLEEILLDESTLTNSPLLPYVRMVVNLVAGLRLSCQELIGRLVPSLRQHSIAARNRADYVLRYLHEHPPSEGVA